MGSVEPPPLLAFVDPSCSNDCKYEYALEDALADDTVMTQLLDPIGRPMIFARNGLRKTRATR
jgi:hypothetical protein